MERFGSFEVGRVVDSGNGSVVYEARKEGNPNEKFVVKVFSPEQLLTQEQAEAKAQLHSLFQDFGASFLSRVELQKKAGEKSRFFLPVLDAAQDERCAWYATRYYARSVKGMLERFVALEAEDLFHVVSTVVKAALYLKKTCGRSHGNLKPSNIFIEGVRKPRSSRVMVADPLAGDAGEAERYERADLRAIGELIYQLVFKRKVDFAWVMVPLESSPDWAKVFGKKTEAWLAICNTLLDPNLSLSQVTLEKLDQELRQLQPKPPVPIVPVAVAAGVLGLAALALFFLLHKRNTGVLVVTTDPPGSRVSVIAIDQDDNPDATRSQTNATALDGAWKVRLEKGRYRLKIEFKSIYGDLPSPHSVPINIDAGRTVRTNFALPYGGLVVRSEPAGAQFQLNGQVLRTPFTELHFPPTNIEFQLRLEGYETTNFSQMISRGQRLEIVAPLRKPPPGSALVEFTSDPPGADLFVDGVSQGKITKDGRSISIEVGRHELVARLAPWFGSQTNQVDVRKEQNAPQSFYFPHGVMSVLTSTPPVLQMFLEQQLVGISPTNLSLPPGRYTFSFRADGYKTNELAIEIRDRATNAPVVLLEPMGGFVDVTSDPPGAIITAAGVVTNTLAGAPVRLTLPPGTNQLQITHHGLEPLWNTNIIVVTKPGQTNALGLFRFRYGSVVFTNARPQEIAADLPIQKEGGESVTFGEVTYQRPATAIGYRVELADYEPWTNRIAATEGIVTPVPVRLERRKMPVALNSNLEGASYSFVDDEDRLHQLGKGTNFTLPWGTNVVIARLSNLQPLQHPLRVQRSGSVIDSFTFSDYGLVITTNLSPGTEVFQPEATTNLYLGGAPAPFYSKPGSVRFVVMSGGAPVDILTNVALGGWIVLAQPMPPITSPASGIEFLWVPSVRPKGAYVGRTEVTQEQFEKVMSASANHSEYRDPKLPVHTLAGKEAEDFCAQLNSRDNATKWIAGGYRYVVPTVAQWDDLARNADPNLGVFSPPRPAPALTRPSPPQTKLADKNGLFDVYGNVWEICLGQGPGDYRIRGGCYDNTATSFKRIFSDKLEGPDKFTGLRVLAVPAGAQ